MKKNSLLCLILAAALAAASVFSGCGKGNTAETAGSSSKEADVPTSTVSASVDNIEIEMDNAYEKPDTDRYIKLALNVYFNDSTHSYFSNESGSEVIYVTKEGKYSLTFDCDKDLSDTAKTAGVSELKNLTAVYITDMEHLEGTGKSPLKSCNIFYDEVYADSEKLTVTLDKPKAAFKDNGVFDTNDPVNSWDGSYVAEVASEEHVANFTTGKVPKKITVVFTLSDLVWDEAAPEEPAKEPDKSADKTTELTGNNKAVFSDLDLKGMDALTLSYYMGNGINLGNTFEAVSTGKNGPVATYESAWGQPKTTKEMIAGYKNAGFDTLRIPVAWTNTMDYLNGDFEINDDYMKRVAEVVDWALENEMFVVLNDHWDSGWWAMYGSKTPETTVLARKVYEEMWKQIAAYFKDYSHMLIFESANEELGNGLNNNGAWADSGSLTKQQTYDIANEINQSFVDLIRSTGGNNSDRFLLIAGYNTDITETCNAQFKMPKDTVKGKLFLSVHYYTPWNYCGVGPDGITARWGIKKDIETMDGLLKKLTAFTDKGYGIILGEYAALPIYDGKEHTTQENTVEFTERFLDNCDIYNYVPLLWDTNSTYDKGKCEIKDPEVAAIFLERSYEKEKAAGDEYLPSVKARMEETLAGAKDMWEGVETYETGTPVAWIMWNGGAGTYSVGDVFNPADNTAGITAHNAIVDKPGEYEVSLDFEGGNDGLTFAALAIADGELLYPKGYIMIDSITLDGEALELSGTPYTTSDDGKCMRVNLLNEWVTQVPDSGRSLTAPLMSCTPNPVDKTKIVGIYNITVKFRLIVLQ